MEITFSLFGQAYLLILEGEIIEKVNTAKMLDIYAQDDYKCNTNVKIIVIKGSQRLSFMTVSKKASVDQTQFLKI